ncbi:hypothetical protein Tco_0578302 [Tanacetum coccineum]
MPRVVKSRDEIFSRWGYCDNHDLSRLDNQSIERDRLIGIGFVLNFVKFISFTFGDKEMISVIEAVLASKEKGGLGVLSFYALNRALLLKWVWRFVSQDGSLWYHVIQAIYGVKINSHPVRYSSNWCSILREMNSLKVKGLYFMSFCSKRIGNGNSTNFWLDIWKGDSAFCELFPRVYALESVKDISVASKMAMQMDSIYFRDLHVEECNGVECCSLFVMSTSWCAYADIGLSDQMEWVLWCTPGLSDQMEWVLWYTPGLSDQMEWVLWYTPGLSDQMEWVLWYAPWLSDQLE